MLKALQKNWRIYLIEAWALGMFMVSASAFTILIEHPALPVREAVGSPLGRRLLEGLAMGLTAVLLIYSPWGKRSGAHMNPAVTLANLQMERIHWQNAVWYIAFQFTGGFLGVKIFDWLLPGFIRHPAINYVVTQPGKAGIWAAFWMEALLAFVLLTTVLLVSNHKRLAKFTGIFAGALVMIFITFEAPYSGMSINPARTVASALNAGIWTAWWIYFVAPLAGMMMAGFLYRRWFRQAHGGNCLGMKCHFSGEQHDCPVYEVLSGFRGVQVSGSKVSAKQGHSLKPQTPNIFLKNHHLLQR